MVKNVWKKTSYEGNKMAKAKWPKVTVGTHLTVTEHEDGRTELVWDDEQLLKEVREATKSVKPAKKTVAKKAPAKKTTKGKTK